jgi:iron complex transport system ATP-binding protein
MSIRKETKEAVLEVKGLSAGYGSRRVINRAEFTLDRGEVVALLGPNGIGKTTLIRALTHAIKPMDGTISLYGEEMARMSTNAIARKVARVVQSPHLAWSFSVRHVVSLGRWPHHGWLKSPGSRDEAVVEEAMREMEVSDLADRDFSTLSGGEAQRVLVAQALAQEPSILIMDEPVVHLDLHHQISALDLVRQLARKGITILASLHDINLAGMYAHRIMIIDNSGEVHIGPASEMLSLQRLESLFGLKLVSLYSHRHDAEYVLPIPGHLENR